MKKTAVLLSMLGLFALVGCGEAPASSSAPVSSVAPTSSVVDTSSAAASSAPASSEDENLTEYVNLTTEFYSNDAQAPIECYASLKKDGTVEFTYKNTFNGDGAIQSFGTGTWTRDENGDVKDVTVSDCEYGVDQANGVLSFYLTFRQTGMIPCEKNQAALTLEFKYKENIEGYVNVNAHSIANCKVTVFDFAMPMSITQNPGSRVKVGDYIAIQAEAGTGYEVDTVKVNGTDTTNMSGYYCLMEKAAEGTTYEVVVTIKEASEDVPTTVTVTMDVGEGGTAALYEYSNGINPTENNQINVGAYIAVKPTANEGYTVDAVTVNEQATQNMNGYYCYMTKVEATQTYTVKVTFKAATAE